MKKVVIRLLLSVYLALLATGALASLGTQSLVFAMPTATPSLYMSTIDTVTLGDLGCDFAEDSVDGASILDFGQPYWNGTTYGTTLFNNSFASISQIKYAAEAFFWGYWDCHDSTFLRVVVGTSNNFGYTGSAHGIAWADMINDLNDYIALPPSWQSALTARGGSDIETGWANPSDSAAWADGYSGEADYAYYDYGDAGGCPPYGDCTVAGGSPDWSQENVWYASWGAAWAYPFPEIYCEVCYTGDTKGGNAAQWQGISLYGYLYETGPIAILGSLTQYAAAGSCCTNTPAQGWSQLWDALNGDWRTAQSLPYSSDIDYQ